MVLFGSLEDISEGYLGSKNFWTELITLRDIDKFFSLSIIGDNALSIIRDDAEFKKNFSGKKQIYLQNILYMYGYNANQEFFHSCSFPTSANLQRAKRTNNGDNA